MTFATQLCVHCTRRPRKGVVLAAIERVVRGGLYAVRGGLWVLRVALPALVAIVVLAALVAGLWNTYQYLDQRARILARGDDATLDVTVPELGLALAGSPDVACELLNRTWTPSDDGSGTCKRRDQASPAGGTAEEAGQASRGAEDVTKVVEKLVAAATRFVWFYAAVGAVCVVGWSLQRRPRSRTATGYSAVGVGIAAALFLVGRDQLEGAVDQLDIGAPTDPTTFSWVASFALATSTLLAVGVLVGLATMAVVVARVIARIVARFTTYGRPLGEGLKTAAGSSDAAAEPPDVIRPWSNAVSRRSVWPETPVSHEEAETRPADAAARWRYASHLPPTRKPGGVGICVSGGGIRSACVTLGALQALRKHQILQRADYLVSVSGGGYMVGAFQLALQPGGDPPIHAGDPADVFAPGSVEVDHLRRHGKYIAESTREWIAALLIVMRNLLASLVLLYAIVVVTGLAFHGFYTLVPVAAIGELRAELDERSTAQHEDTDASEDESFELLPEPVALTLGAVLSVAAALWMPTLWLTRPLWNRALLGGARAVAVAAAAIATVAVVVPALGWLAVRIIIVGDVGIPRVVSVGGLASALTYVSVLATILWRHRERIGETGRRFSRFRAGVQPLEREVATGLVQRLIVWLVLLVLGVLALLLLGATVVEASRWSPWAVLGLPLGLAVAFVTVDQTALSLHPFYRRRLASAFAVRRHHMRGGSVARPYDFVRERTTLSTYANNADRDGMPHVIFGAAAAMSGNDRTPPGRRAVSFTFSHDYIGGPDVGWVRTEALERGMNDRFRRDLTVQSAMAISGAAFASSMGSQADSFQTLFAISNARLGTWLPNPAFLAEMADRRFRWTDQSVPRIRGLRYLLREVFGSYPFDDPMLLCSDGGHYENLGLVELLRHRCETIYCIDSSGDSPPFATTLAEAITLAREELGVRIELHEGRDDGMDLVPGSAEPLKPPEPLVALNARLSKNAVVTGDILYPESADDAGAPRRGRIVVAKASLTADMPYNLLAYAIDNTTFPRRSTADQWFDVGQFDAYRELGQYLGDQAAER